jgi:preprotein translocase subunit YajC
MVPMVKHKVMQIMDKTAPAADVDEKESTTRQLKRQLKLISRSLPEQSPLFAALICSLTAIILSVRTHVSTKFVSLEEPFRVSPLFKDVNYVGLSTWELCSIKQDALETILYEESMKNENSLEFTIMQTNITSTDGTTESMDETYPSWLDTFNALTNTSQQVRSVQPDDILNKPNQDDMLASGDFPYNDDDAFDAALPLDYYHCHHVHISSVNKINDVYWTIARVFFILGSILGITSTGLLITLIVRRRQIAINRQLQIQCSETCEIDKILLLDTDSTGYQPISICFLISYLLQNVTLLFFNSDICRNQVCSIATGARSLLAASLLWVVSGLLVLLMMKKILRNESQVRQAKRKINASMTVANQIIERVPQQITVTNEVANQRFLESVEIEVDTDTDIEFDRSDVEEGVLDITQETDLNVTHESDDSTDEADETPWFTFPANDDVARSLHETLTQIDEVDAIFPAISLESEQLNMW